LLLYGYSYLVAMSKRCVGIRTVRVSFNLDYAIIENRLTSYVQDLLSQIFRTIKPNDFKNSTFAAGSFFLDVLLSFL